MSETTTGNPACHRLEDRDGKTLVMRGGHEQVRVREHPIDVLSGHDPRHLDLRLEAGTPGFAEHIASHPSVADEDQTDLSPQP